MIRKSFPTFQQIEKSNVDRESNIIKNVVIINEGLDKIGDNIDEVFLSQVVAQGNSQSQGVKSRFGHPNLCDDALGSYIGRYKNFRINGGSAIADLHLDPVANESPKGRLSDYILAMAEKNNDMFGNSIVFRDDEPEVKSVEENGEKVEKEFIRLKSFIASDLVDSPAATNSLFKSDSDFAAKATDFLNENPEMFEMIEANPDVLEQFFSKYKSFKEMKKNSLSGKIKNTLGSIAKLLKGEESKAIDVTASDGSVLHISDDDGDGNAAPGDTVTVTGKENPDGSYPMPDGTIINVMNGRVESITPKTAEAPPAAAPEKSVEELNAEVLALSSQLKEKSDRVTELEAQVTEQETEMKSFSEELVKLKSQIKSKYTPDARDNNFNRTGEEAKKSIREQAKEREKEYKKQKSLVPAGEED